MQINFKKRFCTLSDLPWIHNDYFKQKFINSVSLDRLDYNQMEYIVININAAGEKYEPARKTAVLNLIKN